MRFLTVLILLTVTIASPVAAQDYPAKPVRLIVPAAPGGALDTVTRTVAVQLKKRLGVPFPVVNVRGGASAIGVRQVAKAAPDGYTVLVLHQQLLVIGASGLLGFQPLDRLVPLAQTGLMENYLVAQKNAPFNSLSELQAYAKENPGEVKAAVNVGGLDHVVMAQIAQQLGIDFNYVNVPGGGPPKVRSLLGGFTDVGILGNGPMAGPYASGDLKPLATLAPERSAKQHDIPSAGEQGFKSTFRLAFWWFVPKGTPDDVQQTLSAALQDIMADKAVQTQFVNRGIDEPLFLGRKEAIATIMEQQTAYKSIVSLIQPDH